MGLLHENILDQLPPLIDLKRHLSEILMSAHCSSLKSAAKSLLFEEIPEIRNQLIKEIEKTGGFITIAQEQESIFLCEDKDKLMELAQHVTSAYDTDLLAELEERNKDETLVTENPQSTSSSNDKEELNDKTTNSNDENICANCSSKGASKKCSVCKLNFYCTK